VVCQAPAKCRFGQPELALILCDLLDRCADVPVLLDGDRELDPLIIQALEDL
jgi:hypothetical protein